MIYADIGGLERIQADLEAGESLSILNEILRQFDAAAGEFGVERVRPVRNGFLGSCGLSTPRLDNVQRTVDFALECQRIIERFNNEAALNLSLRVGIDTGTVRSGLVGESGPVFDMWGTVVNLAHRIKNGVPQAGIYVTSRVYDALAETMTFTESGTVEVDGTRERIWRLEESA